MESCQIALRKEATQTGSDPDILNFHVYELLLRPTVLYMEGIYALHNYLFFQNTHTHAKLSASLEASGMLPFLHRGDLLSWDPIMPFAVHKFEPIG